MPPAHASTRIHAWEEPATKVSTLTQDPSVCSLTLYSTEPSQRLVFNSLLPWGKPSLQTYLARYFPSCPSIEIWTGKHYRILNPYSTHITGNHRWVHKLCHHTRSQIYWYVLATQLAFFLSYIHIYLKKSDTPAFILLCEFHEALCEIYVFFSR